MEAFEEYAHSSGQLLAYYNDQGKAYDKSDAFQWLDFGDGGCFGSSGCYDFPQLPYHEDEQRPAGNDCRYVF